MIKRLAMLFGAVAVFALPVGLFATPLTLVGPIVGNTVGPQSTSNPCIIAGTQCQQPLGFGFNNFISNGSISDYNMYSTTPTATVLDGVKGTPYTVSQLSSLGSTRFNVAIDVNTTQAAGETLQLFEVLQCTDATCTTTAVLFDFHGPANIGNVNNNGNGFADWTLNTVDLTGLAPTALILFHAVWTNASDGAESFFLIPQQQTVPEPISLVLVGIGLTVLVPARQAMVRRRRSADRR
jgi:hypothetical protein